MKLINLFKLVTLVIFSCSCTFQMPKKGRQKLSQLKDSVEVSYDKYGIPHIEAKNDDDMMYALGYVTASERLFQMDLLRRIGSGRLSEVLGKDLLKSDILLRKLRLKKHAVYLWEKHKDTYPPEMISQINSYFKGVNHYIKTKPLPLEMKILRYKPEPFTVEDSIAIGGYMALSFAEGFLIDTLYTDLLDELPIETVDSLFNRATYDSKENINVEAEKSTRIKSNDISNYSPSKNYYRDTASVIGTFKESLSLFHGSNSWVLSGQRSNSGRPILASDPHIAFAVPGIWFEAHIKSPTYENYGHYLPMLPFPGLGHNSFRAWGITMSNSDDIDFYKETFKTGDSNLVKFKGKFVKVKKETEVIKIKNEPDHIEEVVSTPHGPIVDGTKFVEKGDPISVKWSYLEPSNNSILTFYLLSQSKKLSDLAPALSHAAAPGFNFTFADSKGNIGWHVMGKIPIRQRPGNGNRILDGASGLDEYLGHLDIMDNPHIYNPRDGVIVSANYKHQVDEKIPWIGPWQPKNRYLRIHEVLSSKGKWSLKELKALQTEQKVSFTDETVGHFTKNLSAKTKLHKEAIDLLKKWDGTSNKDDVEPSLYYSMFQLVTKFAVEDELGMDRFQTYLEGADGSHFFANIKHTTDSNIWDDITTKEIKETQSDIFQKAFDESIKTLSKRFNSKNLKDWKWGKVHTVTLKHPMGKFFPLDKIFNIGPYSVGGGLTQINNMGHNKKDLSFDVVYGPTTRRLIDMFNTKISYGGLPSGNSGHPTSPHYDDQAELFMNGEHRDQIMDMKIVKSREHTTLILEP